MNACLKQHFLDHWKKAVILPIPKPQKDLIFATSYRPISLLPSLGKLLEKIILTRLKNSINKCIIKEQFGFRKRHSTVLQLAKIIDDITKKFNLNQSTSMIALDIERAFDTVWHSALIAKMVQLNIPNYLVKLTISYLRNRSFQVKVNKTLSEIKKIPAGVPQGSLLSPTLFTIFINDIPKTTNTELSLFADDTAIKASSFKINKSFEYIQRHITILETYYQKWKIKINADKSKSIYFTKKKKDTKTMNLKF